MKKKATLTLSIICSMLYLLSCKNARHSSGKEDKQKINTEIIKDSDTMNIQVIKEHLILQERIETEDNEPVNPYTPTQLDLDLAHIVLLQILKNSGFQELSDHEFMNKVADIFGITEDSQSEKIDIIDSSYLIYHGKMLDGKKKTLDDARYEPYSMTENIFFNRKKHIASEFLVLKKLIKLNASSYALIMPQYLISRNKYLFNDSKGDFAWLRANDAPFLNQLVKTFGYVKDTMLTSFVLKQNLSNSAEFGKIFWNLTCDKKVRFHNEVIALIGQSTEDEQKKYLDAIATYIDFFEEQPVIDYSINFSQKAEVLGKLAYHAEELSFKINYLPFRFFVLLNKTPEYQKAFEASHYYNIPNFKQMWEDTKTGGVNLPM